MRSCTLVAINMQVHITFTTQVKAALGSSQEVVTLPDDATVLDAIRALAEKHRDVFAQFVLLDGQLMPSILTSVNDQQVDASASLTDGDHIMLLSAISGG